MWVGSFVYLDCDLANIVMRLGQVVHYALHVREDLGP